MRQLFNPVPRALLIALFTYAALSKVLAFSLFRVQLYRQPLPHGLSAVLLYTLPAGELIVAVLLLFCRTTRQALLASMALLLVFTAYSAMALLHWWQHVPCPCGGILHRLGWGQHLAFNLLFLAINLIAIAIHLRERRQQAKS